MSSHECPKCEQVKRSSRFRGGICEECADYLDDMCDAVQAERERCLGILRKLIAVNRVSGHTDAACELQIAKDRVVNPDYHEG